METGVIETLNSSQEFTVSFEDGSAKLNFTSKKDYDAQKTVSGSAAVAPPRSLTPDIVELSDTSSDSRPSSANAEEMNGFVTPRNGSPQHQSRDTPEVPPDPFRNEASNSSRELLCLNNATTSTSGGTTRRSDTEVKAKLSTDKKKKGNWYNVLTPTYKSRLEDFRKLFKDLPNVTDERLVVDYSCALQKEILVHGRLYVTQNYVCFYANIFRWETMVTIKCRSIASITKEKTARVIPNAIQINTQEGEKHFFTSFAARDKTYLMLFRVWQNALLEQPIASQDLWQWLRYSYGEELGLTSSDDEYVPLEQDEAATSEKDKGNSDRPPRALSSPFDDVKEESSRLSGIPSSSPSDVSHGDIEVCNGGGGSEADASGAASPSSPEPLPDVTQPQPRPSRGVATPQTLQVAKSVADSSIPHEPPHSDQGNTSGEDEGHEHQGFNGLDEVFHMSVDQLFEYLFTDHQFYRDFVEARKTYDLKVPAWPDIPDSDGNRHRTLTYTLSLNYSIGPKCSPSTEIQTWFKFSQPGKIYVIDCGVPYSDSFYVINRYCLLRINKHKSRLLITSRVEYRKNVWGLVKNIIEKNAVSGLHENFRLLADHLRRESQQTQILHGAHVGKKRHARHRRPRPQTAKDVEGVTSQSRTNPPPTKNCLDAASSLATSSNQIIKSVSGSSNDRSSPLCMDTLLRVLCVTEDVRSVAEWDTLLKEQRQLHQEELRRWREVLGASIKLIDQMKVTLQAVMNSVVEAKSTTS